MNVLIRLYHALVERFGFGAVVIVCFSIPLILAMTLASIYFRRRQAEEARIDDHRNSLDLLEQGQLHFVRGKSSRAKRANSIPPTADLGDRQGSGRETTDPRAATLDVDLATDVMRRSDSGTVASPALSSERFYEARDIESSAGRSE